MVPTLRGERTRRRRSPGGARIELGLITSSRHRTLAGSKALKPGVESLERIKPQVPPPNGKRA